MARTIEDLNDLLNNVPGKSKRRRKKKSPVPVETPEQAGEKYIKDLMATDPQERGFLESVKSGFGRGVGGILTGQPRKQSPGDETFIEHLGSLLGQTASDIPGMALGAEAGGLAGSLFGPGGAAIGGTAGAFAVPTLINQAYDEYADFMQNSKEPLSFGDFLDRAARVGIETGKSGITGAVAGKIGQFVPRLKNVPGFKKLLSSKLGTGIAETAAETAGITGAQSVLEGETPTLSQAADIAALAGGSKLARAGTSAVKKGAPKVPFIGESLEKAANLVNNKVQPKMERLAEAIKEGVPKSITESYESVKGLKKNAQEKKFFKLLKENVGERDSRLVESQFKWKEALQNAQKTKEFSPQTLEDMIYYRQKTGNPGVKGDSYKELAKRMPNEARKFVDDTVNDHLNRSLKQWNENPITKNIEPREGLEDIYLPGLYEYDPEKFKKGYAEVSKKFKKKNPFSNPKTFLNYVEAFEKAGLKPRYKNMVDLMRAYDSIMIRSLASQELLHDLKGYEKKHGKLVVNSQNREAYENAKKEGWIPFDDPYLRRYVAGTKDANNPWPPRHYGEKGKMERILSRKEIKESQRGGYQDIPAEFGDFTGKREQKPIMATTAAPALVHPDFASAFQGVFNKKSFTPENPIWKAYDSLSDRLRSARVSASPFHYGALMEHAFGVMGPSKALNIPEWTKAGKELRANQEFMKDAARAGLTFHKPIYEMNTAKAEGILDKAAKYMGKESTAGKALTLFNKGANYLFDEFQPNLKAVSFEKLSTEAIEKAREQGRPIDEKAIKRDVAELVNNIYGGQKWETQKIFNDPETRKWIRRIIGYPDWTTSAARTFTDLFAPGLKGEQARKYWLKYGASYVMLQSMLKYINAGLEQTDPDKSIKGIRWNPKKAQDEFINGDPSKWAEFGLPDVDVNIAGVNINPGRTSFGTKTYGHFGKSAREILNWAQHPFAELFAKSNPIIQGVTQQLMGETPGKGKNFPVRGKRVGMETKPWDATEPGTPERALSRIKSLAELGLPFAARPFTEGESGKFIGSLGGLFPTSLGMGLEKSRPYIRQALKTRNTKELNRIIKTLKANKKGDKSIKRIITEERKKLRNK